MSKEIDQNKLNFKNIDNLNCKELMAFNNVNLLYKKKF